MDKATAFKKWFSEHMGHSPQLKIAHEAINELESQVAELKAQLDTINRANAIMAYGSDHE